MTRARDLAAFVSNADGDIKFDTDTLFIDSSANRVGIGETTPVSLLHVNEASTNDAEIHMTNTSSGATASDGLTIFANSGSAGLLYRENSPFRFFTNGSERMRIDADGRVMIGTTTEGAANEAEDLTISSTGQVGITIRSTDSGGGRIYFSDGTSGTSEYGGYQIYDHSDDAMIFGTGAVERMRLSLIHI